MSVRSESKLKRLQQQGFNIISPEDSERQLHLALKYKLGMLDTTVDPYLDPYTNKSSRDMLALEPSIGSEGAVLDMVGTVLKYLGRGLFSLCQSTFKFVRFKADKTFRSYPSMVTEWKSRVWKQSREIDGSAFDAYKVNTVNHADMIKRIQAVEAIHKALSNITGIYNSKVHMTDEWSTPETDKIIAALDRVNISGKHMSAGSLSKGYIDAKKSQPMYLHGYTPKRVLELLTRCEKLAKYGDSKYIDRFETTYLKLTNELEEYEADTQLKVTKVKDDIDATNLEEQRDHIAKIKAARLYWLAHFLKMAFILTTDILKDVESLARATEKCVASRED